VQCLRLGSLLLRSLAHFTTAKDESSYLSGYELFGENIIDFEYILLDVNRYTKEELLKASNIISTVFLMEQSQDDVNNLVEVLKRVQSTLKDIEPQQYDLLVNWFVNIVARGMGKEDADKVKSIIKDSKGV
jgi:hypothetical protein